MTASATERTIAAQLAANAHWAKAQDRAAITAPGHAAFMARFEREVDPDNVLPPAEREQRAVNARSAYFQRLGLASVKSRRKAAELLAAAAAAEAELGAFADAG